MIVEFKEPEDNEEYSLNNFPDIGKLFEFRKLLQDFVIYKPDENPAIVHICGSCEHLCGIGAGNADCVHITCQQWIGGKDCIFESEDDMEDVSKRCKYCEFYLGESGELPFNNPGCDHWVANYEIQGALELFGLLGIYPKVSSCRNYTHSEYKKAQNAVWDCIYLCDDSLPELIDHCTFLDEDHNICPECKLKGAVVLPKENHKRG